MLNKHEQQTPYILQIGDGVIKVLSIANGTEKATLSLEKAHGRLMPKQYESAPSEPREPFEVAEESKGEQLGSSSTSWYPLKLMITPNKSRNLFFDSRRERREVLSAILTEQGFESQLDQYDVERVIDES